MQLITTSSLLSDLHLDRSRCKQKPKTKSLGYSKGNIICVGTNS